MRVLVVSGRANYRHLSDACSYDFEDSIISALEADILTSETVINTLSSHYDLAIIVGVSFDRIRDLMRNLLTSVRGRIDGPVVGYLFGAYGSLVANTRHPFRSLLGVRKTTFSNLDRLYLGIADDAEQIADFLNVPTRYLPMAANVLEVRAQPYQSVADRPIALNAFGRQKKDIVDALCDRFNRPDSAEIVYYTNFIESGQAIDIDRYRSMFWQFLRQSRLSAAFDHFFTNKESARLSYIGPRWFEALAAGTVVIGRAPATEDRAQLLDWPDAAIDLSDDPAKATEEVLALLDDDERIRTASRRNLVEMSRRHDWRHRLTDILSIEGFSPPPRLVDQLSQLEANAANFLRTDGIQKVI